MTGFLVFAFPTFAVAAFVAGQWEFGLLLLAAATICLLLVGRSGHTVKRSAP